MAIQRPSEREQRPSALEVFTDREELIAAFERNLEDKKPEEHRVLVFYGDGGIGKTTLLQKLEQLHRQRCPQALMGRLDLAGADTTPPDLLLYRLRRLFPAISFPSFSLALAEYGRRYHPEQVYGNDRNELLEGAGPYAEVLDAGLKALDKLSGVGLAINAMKAAAMARQQLSDWVQRRAEPLLQRSQSCSEEQLLAQLPLHWARDFRQAISSHLGQDWDDVTTSSQDWDDAIPYSGPPPLIALDTYETLWHTGMGSSGRRREPRERWLVDLVSELPEVLWVIGGRDRLSWEEGYDRGWSEACEQHLVGQLSDDDARSFLAKRGIVEPAIVAKILSQAAGVPFYLELETQLYDKTPAEERTPEVFGGSQQEQIDRLLTHLDASERATLKLMAAFGIWDQDLFRQAVTHFATGYPATGAEELGRFWSIEPIGEGRWQLHNEMAHHLQADERVRDPATFEAVHRWGFNYFDGLLEELETKAIQAKDAERLQRALRHARCIQPAAEWAQWLQGRLRRLSEGTIWQSLLVVAESGVLGVEKELGSDDPAVVYLLEQHAKLLRSLAHYGEATLMMKRALAIEEIIYGEDDPYVAIRLNNLGLLLMETGQLDEAESLMVKALAIHERCYGETDPFLVRTLGNLACLAHLKGRLKESEGFFRRALTILEKSGGTDHKELALIEANLACLYRDSGRLKEAEPLFRSSLEINEASYGPNHPDVATGLCNLGLLLQETSRLEEAEQLIRRALTIDEAIYGPDHPHVAIDLSNLARLLKDTNRFAEAELLMRRALEINEASYNPEHYRVAESLNIHAEILLATKRLAEAEPLFRRALAIDEACYGPDDPHVARDLNYLALLLQDPNRLAEKESLLRRAIAIHEARYGPNHPDVASCLSNLADLLKTTNRMVDAEPLYRRALAINEARYGPNHPDVANSLSILANLLQDTYRLAEAEPLFRRALEIGKASRGPDHPDVARDLSHLAVLLLDTNRLAEAELLMRRALAINEASYGPDHRNVARDLNNLALLLKATDRLVEAEPLSARATRIFLASLGIDHPDTQTAKGNYLKILREQGLPEAEILLKLDALDGSVIG